MLQNQRHAQHKICYYINILEWKIIQKTLKKEQRWNKIKNI